MLNILIIEDSPSLSRTYQGFLNHSGYETNVARSGAQAMQIMEDETFPDLILLDLGLPDMDGIDLLDALQTGFGNIPVIVITANASLNVAVKAMRAGAMDYLVKPFDRTRLISTVENARERFSLRRVASHSLNDGSSIPGGMIGNSRVMQAVYQTISGVSSSDATVFITGESGTGKELAARAVHEQSHRSQHTFHAINCGAIPSELMESEIFGHVKGAFSGASSNRDGAATLADRGTLFLDELGEMPMNLQTKLLRFVQLGTFHKVGDSKTCSADIRFICATNRLPLDAIKAGTLREDLFYRLNVIPIEMPPLRERGDDVLLIAKSFLKRFAEQEAKRFEDLSDDACDALMCYDWPGNVRQLENVIRNAVVLQDAEALTADMLPRALMQASLTAAEAGGIVDLVKAKIRPLAELERLAIEQALEATNGNIQKAARFLEIDPSTIHRRKKQW